MRLFERSNSAVRRAKQISGWLIVYSQLFLALCYILHVFGKRSSPTFQVIKRVVADGMPGFNCFEKTFGCLQTLSPIQKKWPLRWILKGFQGQTQLPPWHRAIIECGVNNLLGLWANATPRMDKSTARRTVFDKESKAQNFPEDSEAGRNSTRHVNMYYIIAIAVGPL